MKPKQSIPEALLLLIKTLVFGIALSTMASITLLSNLLPKQVDYKEKTEEIQLKTGENRFGNVVITIDSTGKVLGVQKIKHKVTNKVSGFRNLRNF